MFAFLQKSHWAAREAKTTSLCVLFIMGTVLNNKHSNQMNENMRKLVAFVFFLFGTSTQHILMSRKSGKALSITFVFVYLFIFVFIGTHGWRWFSGISLKEDAGFVVAPAARSLQMCTFELASGNWMNVKENFLLLPPFLLFFHFPIHWIFPPHTHIASHLIESRHEWRTLLLKNFPLCETKI